MSKAPYFLCFAISLLACDPTRVEEAQVDLPDRLWVRQRPVYFTFRVNDPAMKYNLLSSFRNSDDYPYSRLFVTWRLADSVGRELDTKMEVLWLFDPKSGKPYGASAIGDIFSHDVPLRQGYTFPYRGNFTLALEQTMRNDSLKGIATVGFRLEEAAIK
jgi:gliding motility-associated lipoprotein GldH